MAFAKANGFMKEAEVGAVKTPVARWAEREPQKNP
jgi:hypothetical protein